MNKLLTLVVVFVTLILMGGVSLAKEYPNCVAHGVLAGQITEARDAGISRLQAKLIVRKVLIEQHQWNPSTETFFFNMVDIVYDYPNVSKEQMSTEIYHGCVENSTNNHDQRLRLTL